MNSLFCSDAEYQEQLVSVGQCSSFVNADTNVAIIKVAKVDFFAQCYGAQFLSRYVIRQSQAQGIKEYLIYFFVAQLNELLVQPVGNAMNALCYFFQAFGTVPQCVETSHSSQ